MEKIHLFRQKSKKNKNIDGRFVGITKFSKEIIAKLIKENFFKKNLKENKKLDSQIF